jgi:hypothetical protein
MNGLTVVADQRARTTSLDMDRHETEDKVINDLHHNDDELEEEVEEEEEEQEAEVQLITDQQQQQRQRQAASQAITSSTVVDGNAASNNTTSTTSNATGTVPHYHLPHTPQAQREVIQASHVPYSAPSSSSVTSRSMMDVTTTAATPGSSSASRTAGDLLTEREYKRKSGQSRSLWRERETRLLIEIAVNHLDELKSSAHNKGFLFGMFSDHLRQYGFDRSAEQCRWRWRNLKNEYRRQRAYRMALASGHEYSGPDIIESWPFYDELIYVLGDVDSVSNTGHAAHHHHHATSGDGANLSTVSANTTSVNLDVNEDTVPIKQDLDSLFRLLSAPNATGGDTTASQAETIIQQTVTASTPTHQQQHHHRLGSGATTSHSSGINGTNNSRSPSARPFKRSRLQSNQNLMDVDNTLALDWLEQERARDRALGEGLKERLDRLLELTERNTLATERMAAVMERWIELRDDNDLLLSNDRV